VRVLLVGFGYFPYPLNADKNFFYFLVPHLCRELDSLVFLSVNEQKERVAFQRNGDKPVPVYNLPRPLHLRKRQPAQRKPNGQLESYYHSHGALQDALEKFLSILAAVPTIRSIVRAHGIQLIHFMDNCGPAMPIVARWLSATPVFCSAPCYDPKAKFYDAYLRSSFSGLAGIITYTEAFKVKLGEIGVKPRSIRTIPWGSAVPARTLSSTDKIAIRRKFGVGESSTLLLWSGFIQQIRERDFYRSIAIAREATVQRKDVEFLFVFKPEDYRAEYANRAAPRVQVRTKVESFLDLLETADLFFSPVGATQSTITPPLTWIEAMLRGTPVLTTAIGGVNEVVSDGVTGFVCDSYDRVLDRIKSIPSGTDLQAVSNRACDLARARFDISKVASRLIGAWKDALAK